jgi:hypothetical protein
LWPVSGAAFRSNNRRSASQNPFLIGAVLPEKGIGANPAVQSRNVNPDETSDKVSPGNKAAWQATPARIGMACRPA